jgi:hypothetical protein
MIRRPTKTRPWPLGAALLLGLTVGPALAQTLRSAELKKTAIAASTAAEHTKLAAHYRAHAAEHELDAKIHEDIAAAQRKRAGDDDAWDLARDAAHYAEHSREASEALRDLAQLHEGIAQRLGAK